MILMSIVNTKDEFLLVNNYRPELENFFDYMTNERHWTCDDTIFNGIETIDIIRSLEYNIQHVPYTSKSIARKYSVAICNFFLYAMGKGDLRNTDFYNELVAKRLADNSYYNQINTYISDHKALNDPEKNKAFSLENIKVIIEECNSFLEDVNNCNKINTLGACISIKLMALLGLKYSAVRCIEFADFDGDSILIKGFRIYLPILLKRQLVVYKKNVIRFLGHEPEMLFVKNDGEAWGDNTTSGPLAYVIKRILGSTSTMGISKFGIINLMDADISDSVITELTDAKKDVLSDCVSQRDERQNERYINSRISKISLYYEL